MLSNLRQIDAALIAFLRHHINIMLPALKILVLDFKTSLSSNPDLFFDWSVLMLKSLLTNQMPDI